ncbi:anaerobic carbon-monoxide dehydrogenase catalytic subunit [Desulfotomaculum copahuensis]|uniref:Carbon monoxide dehydrogenase n=1 Tax=Desulfotomaculum copahuensis TaxID=1838280 RepID=A0A1B7LHC7_9FIRM|nr:anaerobic carbon-monoxide dehydrogenase catalytic subunit [Desulfotomaculum copahuensis]OAT85708.1 carbon-monoxide dehydrogenase catalytic subunit [Desulfotomaculum copahuensis]
MPRFRDPGHTCRPSDAPRVVDPKVVKRSIDPAVLEMIDVAKERGMITAFDRVVAQQPQCQFGYKGICCRFCMAGPCRIKAEEGPASRGICGASVWTVVARSVGLMLLTGAASHSEHASHIAHTLHEFVEGHAPDYGIKDPDKLRRVAKRVGIEVEGKDDITITKELTAAAMADYSRLNGFGESTWVQTTVTEGRLNKFRTHNVMPSGVYNTISDLVTEAHIGMDNDPVNIIFSAIRVALGDYVGMHVGTDLSDVLFGTPKPVVSEANMGVIDPSKVNLVLHGHNPVLSDIIVQAAREMEAEAKAAGATGINLMGICCTGNEVLMRHGVPLVTSFASQELAIATGSIDGMVVDVQCIMPSVRTAAECFHTLIITTSPIAKIPGSYYLDFQTDKALENAKAAIRLTIEAFKRRDPDKVHIPQVKNTVVAGWSLEALYDLFRTVNPDEPVKALTDAIMAGEIKGVALLAGCNNLKRFQDHTHDTLAKELLKNDVFVVATGCAAQGLAKLGMMAPEAVEFAGEGLKKFLARISEKANLSTPLPPVFHMGSCVDNTRASDLLMDMANAMGVDTPKVPFVASAPEAMSGKAVSIGTWFVAMGVPVHVGAMPPVEGSDLIYSIITQVASDVYGGYFIFEMDPNVAASKILSALEYRTWKLGVHRAVAEDMETALCQNY